MLIAVVGGKLQGVEITYLAKKAGYDVLLIDKTPDVPACGLCDQFVQAEAGNSRRFRNSLEACNVVFPAFENLEGLALLDSLCREIGVPFVFDLDAYRISSSKRASDQLFADLKLSQPVQWPDCGFPIVVKPSEGSGSDGVKIYSSLEEVDPVLLDPLSSSEWVVQQYLAGPSYSIEVVGTPGNYHPLLITDLEMDDVFDCKRVTAPTVLPEASVQEFGTLAIQIANAIKLKGIMDVEVILNNGQLKILEIDARFPSQTPTAVYWSSGINMVRILTELWTSGQCPDIYQHPSEQFVIFEHIRVTGEAIHFEGEHIMGNNGRLFLEETFYGADEALTTHQNSAEDWVATVITTGKSKTALTAKKQNVIRQIKKKFWITQVIDKDPMVNPT